MKTLDGVRTFHKFTAAALFLAAFAIAPALALAQENVPDIPVTEKNPASPPDPTPVAGAHKPNIVFILADNVGYGDLGSYGGGEVRGAPTPRLDELANQGMRLTQFLVEPGCTPSRAALMTGQYSIRSGLSLILIPGSGHNTPWVIGPILKTIGQYKASLQSHPNPPAPNMTRF